MSDVSQGAGWWQASDGKWYPPQPAQSFAYSNMPSGYPTAPRPERPAKPGLWIGILILSLAAIVGLTIKQTIEIYSYIGPGIPPTSSDINVGWEHLVAYIFVPMIIVLISIPTIIYGFKKNRRLKAAGVPI